MRDLCLVAPCSHTLLGYIFNFLNVGVKREGRVDLYHITSALFLRSFLSFSSLKTEENIEAMKSIPTDRLLLETGMVFV